MTEHGQGERGALGRRHGKDRRRAALGRWRGATRGQRGGEDRWRRAGRPGAPVAGREIPLRGERRPHLADPRGAARARHEAHPHAPRAVMRLRRRRLGADHRNARRLQRHRRLRIDQRRHRPLCTAGLAGSAVVCIAGQHPTTEDGLGSFQEAYGSEVCRSFSKSVKRVLDWSAIEVDLRQAFREATAPPQGVALVEIPTNILYQRGSESGQRRGAKVYRAGRPPLGSAIPRSIERAIEILLAAERPLIAAGDGVFWSAAGAGAHAPSPSSRAYRSMPGAPARAPCRRITRSRSAVRGRSRSPAAPTRCSRSAFASGAARSSARRRPGTNPRATSRPMRRRRGSACMCRPRSPSSATPKLVLRQLGEAARRRDWTSAARSSWLREVDDVRANYDRAASERGARASRRHCRSIRRGLRASFAR